MHENVIFELPQADGPLLNSSNGQACMCVVRDATSIHSGHPSIPADCPPSEGQEVHSEDPTVPLNKLLEALGPDYQWVYQLTANTGSAMSMGEINADGEEDG